MNNPRFKVIQTWMKKILLGLKFLHEKNIIHGSISS